MAARSPSHKSIELRAGGAHDPDASRAAAVLAAYFEAEEARALHRTLWKRLAMVGLMILMLAITTSIVPHAALAWGLVVVAGVAVAASVDRWRLQHKLHELIDSRHDS
jgi:hypothetical protein